MLSSGGRRGSRAAGVRRGSRRLGTRRAPCSATVPLTPETIEGFRRHLDGWSHLGVRAAPSHEDGSATLGTLIATWNLLHGSTVVGSARRSLKQHADGRVYVTHNDLTVYEDRRPDGVRGVARSVLAHELDQWEALEIAYVRLDAHGIGSYLWATCGFDFDAGHRPADQNEGAAAARSALTTPGALAALSGRKALMPAEVQRFAGHIWTPGTAVAAEYFTRPSDIAAFVSSPAGLAREVLAATAWPGIRML